MIGLTVGSDVKNCYFSIKSATATLQQLTQKTNDTETKETFLQAEQLLLEVKNDLKEQVLFLAREEPQYK